MACTLFSRLFRRRQVPDAFAAPALPVSTDEDRTALETLAAQEDADGFHLGCLSEQGSYSLIVPHIPRIILHHHIDKIKQDSPGYVSVEYLKDDVGTHIVLNFATAAEAAMALATHPVIDLGLGARRQLRYADPEDDSSTPARKRTKVGESPVPVLHCQICSDELDAAYSQPCYYCKATWCHDCVKKQFMVALDSQEMFPAKCCGRVLHFDVARAVIPASDYTKYKNRFEQHNTTKPIYCANIRCSAFLPARISKPDERGHVQCSECGTSTCGGCRAMVDIMQPQAHTCVASDEATALLKQFNYKRCPRCNGGVAKMFGCSHVRDQCGAHWCWDCERPIQICWSRPCDRARDDGNENDDFDIPEEDAVSEDDSAQGTIIVGPTATQAQIPTSTEPENVQASQVALHDSVAEVNGEEAGLSLYPSYDGVQIHEIWMLTGTDVAISNSLDTEAVSATTRQVDAQHANIETELSVEAGAIATPAVSAPRDRTGSQTLRTTRSDINDTTVVSSQSVPDNPAVNLDGEDAGDWEAGSYDFGEEPIDETWDTWGCLHQFVPVLERAIWSDLKGWLPDTSLFTGTSIHPAKQLDCLRCYKSITLVQPVSNIPKEENGQLAQANTTYDDKPAAASTTTIDTVSTPTIQPVIADADKKSKKRRKQKAIGDLPKAFNCINCGMFYCVECKKVTAKEIQNGLQAQVRV